VTQPAATNTTGGAPETSSVATPAPQPQYIVVNVRAGKPVGGVRTIALTSGDRARIEVRSADTSDEVHLHGYDIKRDLKPGGRVRFSFKADAEGIFEMELESSATQIAKLKVEPG
jgi:heme/copper-type cytochrome/quinol oxidase subunit 2